MEDILGKVEDAFSTVAYPDGELVEPTNNDDGVRDRYSGTTWKDHVRENGYYPWDLWFFTPAAFVYFLPAFLQAAATNINGDADVILSHLIAQFNPYPITGDLRRTTDILSRITDNQRLVLLDALKAIAGEYWPCGELEHSYLSAVQRIRGC